MGGGSRFKEVKEVSPLSASTQACCINNTHGVGMSRVYTCAVKIKLRRQRETHVRKELKTMVKNATNTRLTDIKHKG